MLKKNEKGQAIFEFIIFVPFLVILYSSAVNLFAAINTSINQQKVTRTYLYSRMRNNSFQPSRRAAESLRSRGRTKVGFYANGWRENRFTGGTADQPEAPCVKLSAFAGSNATEGCLDKTDSQDTTAFLRVKTVYGICGQVFDLENKQILRAQGNSSFLSCTLD